MLLDRFRMTLLEADTKSGLAVFLGPQVGRRITEALTATRKWQLRRRDLSANLMMYVVLAMVYFRSLSVPNVFKQLFSGAELLLPGGRRTVAESSLVLARYRLGPEPFEYLFNSLAAEVVPPPTFHGHRVHSLDGVQFPVADTPENEAEFGRPGSRRGRTARPVARIVTLAAAYSHEVEGIDVGGCRSHERSAVAGLIAPLTDKDVVILDRLYPSVALFELFHSKGVKVVARINRSWRPKIVRTLRTGDYIVETDAKRLMTAEERAATQPARRGRGALRKLTPIQLRMIVYTCGGKGTIRLLTSLPLTIPALDIAKLYHERWEIELINDEIKNHLASPLHGTEELRFRSKFPRGVRQEIYATYTAHLLLRQAMRIAAETYGRQPLSISLTDSLNTIRRFLPLLQFGSSQLQPLLLRELYQQIALDCQLRPRRNRQYARKVRVKFTAFQCKTQADVQRTVDHRGLTRLAKPAPDLAGSS